MPIHRLRSFTSILFDRTCDTFREALLQAEEYDRSRNSTDKYTKHQHTVIYGISAQQVRY